MGVELNTGIFIYCFIYIVLYNKVFKLLELTHKIWLTVWFIYVCFVVDLTLFPIPLTLLRVKQLRVLKEMIGMTQQVNLLQINMNEKQFFYNVLMFTPFGLLINKLFLTQRRLLKTVCFSFLFSFFIESLQLISIVLLSTMRIFDINDLLANTLGGICGLFVYVLWSKFNKLLKSCRSNRVKAKIGD